MSKFKLIMISAMYENGGNTLQRHLDGHPKLLVYPFESQLGTKYCQDMLSSLFPYKYRWPEFPLENKVEDDFELIYDEELKTRLRSPKSSKFREFKLEMTEEKRKHIFIDLMKFLPRTRKNIIEAFFRATFQAWEDYYSRDFNKKIYVGYSPIVGVDAEKMISDFDDIKIIHIVRNPYSAYAETKHRPYPLNLKTYVETWSIVQYYALIYSKKYKDNFKLVRYEDLVESKKEFFLDLVEFLEIEFDDILLYPSWNKKKLPLIYPWGTIKEATKT